MQQLEEISAQARDLETEVITYKTEGSYSLFAEQYLEEPVMEEGYSPIRSMGSWIIPTFCTWKFIPTIDDVDDL